MTVDDNTPHTQLSDGTRIPIDIRVVPTEDDENVLDLQIRFPGKEDWTTVEQRRIGLLPSVKFEPSN